MGKPDTLNRPLTQPHKKRHDVVLNILRSTYELLAYIKKSTEILR